MVTGIAGVWLSIKEKILAWPLFIFCYAAYVYISFRGSYYAFGGMNILFVGVAAYGWYKWAGNEDDTKSGNAVVVSHLSKNHRWMVALFICVCTGGLGTILASTEGARLPYYDAFATACALSAQWMLGRKHIENWLFWIVADIIYLGFFLTDRVWPSVILFTVFIGLAINGWLEWRAILRQPEAKT